MENQETFFGINIEFVTTFVFIMSGFYQKNNFNEEDQFLLFPVKGERYSSSRHPASSFFFSFNIFLLLLLLEVRVLLAVAFLFLQLLM